MFLLRMTRDRKGQMNENTEATTSKDKIGNPDYIIQQPMKPKNTDQYKRLRKETTNNSLQCKRSHISDAVSRELRENVNKQCTLKSCTVKNKNRLLCMNNDDERCEGVRVSLDQRSSDSSSENGDSENILAKNTKESKTVYTNIDNETTGNRFKRFILSSLQRSHSSTGRGKKHSDCHQLLDCGNNPYMSTREHKTKISKKTEQRYRNMTKFSRVSTSQILQWSQSFDSLLNDESGLQWFSIYLKSEFSEENLQFWIECEEFRLSDNLNFPAFARKICNEFVAVDAPREVNLDYKTRMAIFVGLGNNSNDTFKLAQRKIQTLMERDSYPRFIESELYQHILRTSSKD